MKPHIKFAIEHEKACLELRKRQIQGYEKKIALLESGNDYFKVLKAIPPVKMRLKFNKAKYFELRWVKR